MVKHAVRSFLHPAFLAQHALDFVHDPCWQVTRALVAGFGVVRRYEYAAPVEIQMLELDPHKFPDTTAQVVDNPKHELVPVVLHAIEEFLPFIKSQIPYGFPKTLVFP